MTKHTIICNTYELLSIVVVPFPFTDTNQVKRRPAVVLSAIKHQEETNHITLAMITSAKNSSWPDDHVIKDLESAGLPAPSVIRQKIFTIDSSLIFKMIGELSNKDKTDFRKKLQNHLPI